MWKKYLLALLFLSCSVAFAAKKPKVITRGPAMTVKLFLGPSEDNTVPMKVRPLYIDGKLKEFTVGEQHEVTDRLFVVRRAFRINNSLPDEETTKKLPNWMWQKGGWLLVDRQTGRVSQISLPEFDPYYSEATWFRDYVAYCGISDKNDRLNAVVMQLGNKKPVIRKELGEASNDAAPDSNCAAPEWQRQPTRVTFVPKKGEKVSFTVFGHSADIAPGSDED